MTKILHIWVQDGETWACVEYDHGPFCRLCKRIDWINVKPSDLPGVLAATNLDVREAREGDPWDFNGFVVFTRGETNKD